VTVIHYNVSVAHELQMKGETTPHGPLWRQAMRAEASALPLVDGIIFVSGFMRRVVLERLPVLATVPHTVIPNFVAGASAGAPGPSWAGDVIAIGSLEPRKNQAFLLHVLARAKALGLRCTLTLVGDGPDQARLVALADELGVAHQVNFAGFQPRAAGLIAQHRVLAHAALVENLPLALIEALAAGRPILAPAVGGIPEVFTHGSAGYHWALDNVDAAARLLIGVLSDSEEYARLARAAVARYRSAFDPDVLVPRWLTAILPPLPPPAADPAGAPPAPLRRERGRAGTAKT
jgi:glycosyltransferase involved in cell wall biosynthesis